MSTQTIITLNGVQKLTQWDTNRTVSVTGDIPIVHFSNDSAEAISIAVKNGLASIPNILLQDSVPITAWAFVVTESGGYTQCHVQFDVCAKPRPLDYIYTETEVANIGLVLRYIGELSSLVTSNKTSLVAAINEISVKTGVTNHSDLNGKDLPNQHSISAITGLTDELNAIQQSVANTATELAGTKTELADTKSELENATTELADTKTELADTKTQLENAVTEFTNTAETLQTNIDSKQPKGDYLTVDTLPNASTETAGIVKLDNEAIEGSDNAISSGAVYALIGNVDSLILEINSVIGAGES